MGRDREVEKCEGKGIRKRGEWYIGGANIKASKGI